MIGYRPTHSENSAISECPRRGRRREEAGKESSVRPPTLRRNRFERRAGKYYSFRTRSYSKSREGGFPWERRSRASRNIRVESESRRYTWKKPERCSPMHRKDGEKCRITSGQDGVFTRRRRPLPPPSLGGADDEKRRCDAFGTSEVKVSREWPRKITAEKKGEEKKNERDDVSLVSKFETPLAPLRDYSPLLRCSFFRPVRPICRLRRKKQSLFVSR